jgi:eukaryotic-like serine/threonine-protein kinase
MVEHLARTPAHRVVTGRYALTSRLGQRGTRTSWRAEDVVLRRDVAVEEIRFPSGEQESARISLLRRAWAAARLPLPGTITVFDAVQDGDELFVVTELVAARTLAQVVEQDGPLPPDRAAAIGLELLAVLDQVERTRIVHDGVSPANVLLVDGRAKLSGFGLGEEGDVGTDLRALGATLHFAVTGRVQQPLTPAPGLRAALVELLGEDPEHRPSLPRLRQELAALAEPGRAKAVVPRPVGAASAARLAPPEPLPTANSRTLAVANSRTPVVAPTAPKVPAVPEMPAWTWRRALRPVPVALLVAVAVALLVAVAVALLLPVLLPDRALAPAPPDVAATASTPVARQPDRTSGTWKAYEHAGAGLTIRVPAAWSSEERPNRLVFRAPDRTASVALSWTDGPLDPLAEVQDRAFQFRAAPGYRELELADVTFRGRPAAEWEFLSAGPGGRVHGRTLALNGPRHGYVLSIEALESAWPAAQPVLKQISEGLMVG